MSLYAQRGVSAQKEDVHTATASLSKGLFPFAFCKLYPDYLGGDTDWVNVMHADGAGTKSILAYLYWKETGDLSVWGGIARDAIVMNLDDLLCTGICDNILFSSTIDRNKRLIPGEVLTEIIGSTNAYFEELRQFGVNIQFLGGETADVGDVVRTIAVNGTMAARWPKDRLVTNERIAPGDVIVGLSSSGMSSYETEYNSGIGSNGLTSARHDALDHQYGVRFPESFDPALSEDIAYIGTHRITDQVETGDIRMSVGKLLLSPTRTYAPVMMQIFRERFASIHGLIHCSGGGQTKCLKYLPGPMRVVKDNLFDPPPVFDLIQQASGADDREMYQVFNMGHRLELFTPAAEAQDLINTATAYGIEARIIGRVEAAERPELHLVKPGTVLVF